MKSFKSAFTLLEVLIIVVIVAVLAALAAPVIGNAIYNVKLSQATEQARMLNQAANQARQVDSVSGYGTIGSDKTNAVNWYITYGYIGAAPAPDISNVDFTNGLWVVNVH